MLIDKFLPEYQIGKAHEIMIHASAKEVYEAVSSLNMNRSALINMLFKIRGLPESALTLHGLQKLGFTLLGQHQNKELLLGLVGQFWKLSGNLQRVEPAAFRSFNKHGFAKAAWNFSLVPQHKNKTKLKTETRISCPDKNSYIKFRFYWLLIGPFSSWIRNKSLKIIKQEAEHRFRANPAS